MCSARRCGFGLLKGGVDRRVLWSFGATSAAGGLAGAALQGWLGESLARSGARRAIALCSCESDRPDSRNRLRFRGVVAWLAGALSGLLGGLVGNQGGIRSAALLGSTSRSTPLSPRPRAIGLFVDGARMPVYLVTQGPDLLVGVAVGGVGLGRSLCRHGARQPHPGPHSRSVVQPGPGSRLGVVGDRNDVPRCQP